MLATRKQCPNENIDLYLQALKQLSKDCDFAAVDAETNKNDNVRDDFISGISSSKIRQRLLENLTLTLYQAYNQALSLETAEVSSQSFNTKSLNAVHGGAAPVSTNQETIQGGSYSAATYPRQRKCFYCCGHIHPRKNCPALETACQLCNKKGHFATVCRSSSKPTNSVTTDKDFSACVIAASPLCITQSYLRSLSSTTISQTISMASLNHTSPVEGQTCQTLTIGDHNYDNVTFLIVKNICADIIIGHDVLGNHASLEFSFGGRKVPLHVCNVAEASVPAVPLFANVSPECKPIAIKSRKHSDEDTKFIKQEIENLLAEGVIEESKSPWRAQVLITKNETHRKRLVIDYSRTINRYTELDAYPLPNIEQLVTKVAKNKIFSLIDLKGAYHQVPILPEERKYTAFEAHGNLYQFRRIPFGVTNGVSSFQRTIDWIIRKIGSPKHVCSINILGYNIHNHIIKPDSERLQPLINLPPPCDVPTLSRTLGMFAHYSNWIPNFSERIQSLSKTATFPLTIQQMECFNSLKNDIAKSSIYAIDENLPFTKEAYAIVESLKKWRHFLIGKHFRLITDQRSVSFRLYLKHSSKIKLAPYKYEIIYRPGKENYATDAVTRMFHWIRSKNLPYTLQEVRSMTSSCRTCSEIKPRFFRRPVPTKNNNRFILTAIDEFSRFPFAFACSDVSSKTVIKHLHNLFMIFGKPSYIHSDRGTAFLSAEVQDFLHARGIATSRTTPYNPQGNGQVEKLKTGSKYYHKPCIPFAPYCTATNCTPHERMFRHPHRSTNGISEPTWLTSSGQVLLKKFNRTHKYQPIVEEVELLHSNPDFSFIRFPDGRETTVSNRHLAPLGSDDVIPQVNGNIGNEDSSIIPPSSSPTNVNFALTPPTTTEAEEPIVDNIEELRPGPDASLPLPQSPESIRKSSRIRRPPKFLEDYVTN
ncbi:hypothetical protein ABMA27_010306 [Loxostege sticticalis]|uniref:Integrase catalytic domain-containing protein n=1 Tax=Loxostege sticticalis TaxID=481309 RepID=A0ABR3H5B1_LOXSC